MSLRKKTPKTAAPPNKRLAGRISGIFGLHGELKVDATTAGRAVFVPGARLDFVGSGRTSELTVGAIREHQGRALVLFEGVSDAKAARDFVGGELFAPRDAFILESGEYLDEDLVGCRLVDEHGNDLGAVSAVEHYPAQDVLVFGAHRLPLVHAFVHEIDLAARRISVRLPAGLLD